MAGKSNAPHPPERGVAAPALPPQSMMRRAAENNCPNSRASGQYSVMTDVTDSELMQDFADHQSEAAFAQLVQRHINLVYSVALRFTGQAEDARDVTQAVFIILAQKASGLRQRTTLTGWLYETTRLTARQSLRTRARQFVRDQEAYMQSHLNAPDTDSVWQQLAPQLEAAMSRLNENERALLALRFFENKTGEEAAARLGIRADAAHKRTARAVEKLRGWFTQRGVTLTATELTAAIAANSVQAAPVGLAATVTAAAAKGAAVSGSTLTLIKGALKIMAWTKMKTAIVVGVGAVLVGTSVYQAQQVAKLREQNQTLQKQQAEQLQQLQHERDDATNQLAAMAAANSKTKRPDNELLKLRGEVGVLRTQNGELAKLQNENLKLKRDKAILEAEWNNVTNSAQIMHGPYLNRASWSDAGTTNPLNTLQSLLWALRENNEDKIGELVLTNGQNLKRIYLRGYWDRVKGVHIMNVVNANDTKGQPRAIVETIVEQTEPTSSDIDTQSPAAQNYLTTRQTIRRWFLAQIDGQWQITGTE